MTDKLDINMRRERALAVIEAYGADVERWPARERAALLSLIDGDQELQKARDEQRALDIVLHQKSHLVPDEDLMSRILGDAAAVSASWRSGMEVRPVWQQLLTFLWPYGPVGIPAGALAASVMLGITVGAMSVDPSQQNADENTYELIAFAVGDTILTEEWQ